MNLKLRLKCTIRKRAAEVFGWKVFFDRLEGKVFMQIHNLPIKISQANVSPPSLCTLIIDQQKIYEKCFLLFPGTELCLAYCCNGCSSCRRLWLPCNTVNL